MRKKLLVTNQPLVCYWFHLVFYLVTVPHDHVGVLVNPVFRQLIGKDHTLCMYLVLE